MQLGVSAGFKLWKSTSVIVKTCGNSLWVVFQRSLPSAAILPQSINGQSKSWIDHMARKYYNSCSFANVSHQTRFRFVYAAKTIPILRKCRTLKALHDRIKSLPNDINGLYDTIFERI